MHKAILALTVVALVLTSGCRPEEDDSYNEYNTYNYYDSEDGVDTGYEPASEPAIITSMWDVAILLSQGEYEVSSGDEIYLGTSILQANAGGISTVHSLSYRIYWSYDTEQWWPLDTYTQDAIDNCELNWYFPVGSRQEPLAGSISNGIIKFDVDIEMDSEAVQNEIAVPEYVYPKIYCQIQDNLSDVYYKYFKMELFHVHASSATGTSQWYEETTNGPPQTGTSTLLTSSHFAPANVAGERLQNSLAQLLMTLNLGVISMLKNSLEIQIKNSNHGAPHA